MNFNNNYMFNLVRYNKSNKCRLPNATNTCGIWKRFMNQWLSSINVFTNIVSNGALVQIDCINLSISRRPSVCSSWVCLLYRRNNIARQHIQIARIMGPTFSTHFFFFFFSQLILLPYTFKTEIQINNHHCNETVNHSQQKIISYHRKTKKKRKTKITVNILV